MARKILYISGSMPPLRCGVGFYTDTLLDRMPRGFDLLTTAGLKSHARAAKNFAVPDWKLRRLPKLLRLCLSGTYDVIHIQYPARGYGRQMGINFLPYLLRLAGGSKLVVSLHEYHGSGLLGKSRDFITALPAHSILVSNPHDLKALPWIHRRKSRIVPIGSNVPVAKPNPKMFRTIMKQAGFSSNKKVAVYFGFPFPNKGIETAIEAVSHGDLQLLLLSNFDLHDSYQAGLLGSVEQAKTQGARIYIAGFLEDKELSEVLQECDYFVLPQPLPLTAKSSTALTAAIHGLVVVSTAADDQALNKPYINGVNSVLLKPMSATGLRKALKNSPPKASFAKTLGELTEYFSWDNIVREHNKTYEEILR